MFSLRELPSEQRHEVYQRVRDDAVWSYRYITLLSLSAVIASFGLLADSTAVVIGAMIIAPLMGPILGLSLGMVRGSPSLERRSLIAEGIGVVVVVAIAFLVGLLPFTLGISQEMLARTAPTTFDIAIALASGFAGAYASVNPKISATLAGVAISVALVPPLASSGLMFAFGRPDLGLGALLLWLANFLSIQLAAAIVYAFYGFVRRDPDAEEETRRRLYIRFTPSLIALGLVGWFLTATLIDLFRSHTVEIRAKEVLSEQIAKRTGGRLDEILLLQKTNGGWNIVASALTPQPFDVRQVRQIQESLADSGIESPHLIIRSLVSQDVSANGRVYLDANEVAKEEEASRQATYLEVARTNIRDALKGHEGLELVDVERGQQDGIVLFTATVRAPDAVMPKEVATVEEQLNEAFEGDVRLVVRSVTTRDADSRSFLFQPPDVQPDPQVVALRTRIEPILRRRLNGRLTALLLAKENEILRARITLEAPAPADPEVVRSLEADLRENIDPRIRLTVATNLVAG
jgi:uncharacterized hydrophobic protein (TIGR00271 family)